MKLQMSLVISNKNNISSNLKNTMLLQENIKQIRLIFLKLGFTPCKDEKPLRGMESQEEEEEEAQKIKGYRKSA